MAWTLLATQDVNTYYRGGTSPAKVQTFSYDLGGGDTLYKTVTYFKDGEVSSTLASIPAGGGGGGGPWDLTSDVTGILPIANGGTNSSTALGNGKMMASSGGAIVESTINTSDVFNKAGVSGGQTAYGGTASGNNLQLYSTTHATKGKILFGSTAALDETVGMFGSGTQSPAARFHSSGDRSMSSWTVNGVGFRADSATLTNTSSSGTVAAQVAHSLATPTFAFSSATIITDASTFYIAAAPTAGTNATLTRPWAQYIAAGRSYFAEGANFGTATQTATIRIASSMTGTNAAANSFYGSGAVNVTSAGSYQSAALTGDSTVTGSQNNTNTTGVGAVDAIARCSNTATATAIFCHRATAINSSTGTVTHLYQYRATGATNSGGGTITNIYGLYVDDVSVATNNYAAFLNLSSGSGKWNVYANGTATNYMNGSLTIGTTAASAKLHVVSTTEQERLGYDTSNYYSTTVSSVGLVTFDAVGSGAGFAFSDAISIPTASPASNGTGRAGQLAWDGTYLYVCTATNTWARVAITGGY